MTSDVKCEYYVYKHTFSNGKIYIGKGIGNRCHDFRNRSTYWKRLYAKYNSPIVEIIDNGLDEDTAFELESFCLSLYLDSEYCLGGTLVNFTMGGEGVSGYQHTVEAKELISKASKDNWLNNEYREKSLNAYLKYHKSEVGRLTKKRTSTEMWQKEEYRTKKVNELIAMWKDPVFIEKMSLRMQGKNNPAARTANIYAYPSGDLIAENVVSAEWARDNGYSRSKLQATVKANREIPSSKDNPHHHKNIYMEYTDGD